MEGDSGDLTAEHSLRGPEINSTAVKEMHKGH
jgi:hypothetical protein